MIPIQVGSVLAPSPGPLSLALPLLWLAPVAATAAPLPEAMQANLAGVDRYAAQEQVTSISQFSDLQPTDWAFQALANLIERYGCVAGYPDASFRGQRAMTRFEAAALLNACLDRVTEVTDELKRLMAEFEQELAILKGRVDGLEAKVGELEANQFSTTTKLSGLATFVVGGVNNSPLGEQVSFNYDVQLNLDTSFTGKDLLRTILRAGNFDADRNAFGAGLSALEVAFQEEGGPDSVGIDKLYYQFPIGSRFTATVGPRVGQEDMLALWPSAYPSDTILNLLTLNGAPIAYNKNLGPGAGIWWQQQGFSVSANYVAARGADSSIGLFSSDSAGTATVQLGYGQETWGLAAIYSSIEGGVEVPGGSPFVSQAIATPSGDTNAFGISGFWQPSEASWIPSISAGYGYNRTSGDSNLRAAQSWMVGLQWNAGFADGHAFGMALGQPGFATDTRRSASTESGLWAMEAWYQWQLTDAIAITPAVFYLTNPEGNNSSDQFGALLKTSFSF